MTWLWCSMRSRMAVAYWALSSASAPTDHAIFQRLAHAEVGAHVAAAEVAGETKLGVVGHIHRLPLSLEAEHRYQGAESFLFRAKHVVGGRGHHSRLE